MIIKNIKRILTLIFIATILVSASCNSNPEEFGLPYATFIINGTVQSNTTTSYIPGIMVIMGFDTVGTKTDGTFEVSQFAHPEDSLFLLKFVDLDGAANESLKNLDTVIKFSNPVFINPDGKWNKGETEKTIQIKLKEFDEVK